jgi:hypothetical protein
LLRRKKPPWFLAARLAASGQLAPAFLLFCFKLFDDKLMCLYNERLTKLLGLTVVGLTDRQNKTFL